MRCLYREKKYYCGEYLEVDIYPVFEQQKGRGRKKKPTSEVQKRLNQRNAEQKLVRLLNTNFTSRDIRLDLTYDPKNLPESPEEAQRQMQNFLRRVKRLRAKKGLPELKYVAVTEVGERNGRYHHHIVMSGGLDVNELDKLWGRGYTTVKPLRFDEFGIVGIAVYLVKNPILGKRWCASKNLDKPKERQRDGVVSHKKAKELWRGGESCKDELEWLNPGYTLSGCNQYFNDVNGGVYLTVVMKRKDQAAKKPKKPLI